MCHGLDTVKAKYNDIYHTQNYVQTLKELLKIARVKIDEELDTITLNRFSQGYNERVDRPRGLRSSREEALLK